jgi:hypothetical protein
MFKNTIKAADQGVFLSCQCVLQEKPTDNTAQIFVIILFSNHSEEIGVFFL